MKRNVFGIVYFTDILHCSLLRLKPLHFAGGIRGRSQAKNKVKPQVFVR